MLTYGSILHSLLYHINLAIKNKEKYDIDTIIQEKVPRTLSHFNFRPLIENYLNTFKDELNQIVSIEKPFEFSLGDSIINGRMDLLVKNKNGKYAIVEFKSGTWDYQKEDDTRKQVNLYALSEYNYDITEGIIYFFGSGGKRIDFKITKKQTELEIYDAISKISVGKFDKDIRSCANCVFNDYPICPYKSSKNPNTQKDSDDEDEEKRDSCSEL
jgi:hypothetical protein